METGEGESKKAFLRGDNEKTFEKIYAKQIWILITI